MTLTREQIEAIRKEGALDNSELEALCGLALRACPPDPPQAGMIAEPVERAPWPDPTPAMLDDPLFSVIWNVIKSWDVNVPSAYSGYCGATGNHARAIYDGVRALPLPEGDGLSREKILLIWSDLESGRALPHAEDLRAVFSLALRAMPLPKGEPGALVKRLEEHYDFQCEGGPLRNCVEWIALKATIERQADSLATVERERDEQEKRANSWRHDFLRAEKECRAAEASLASAPTDDRLRKLIDSAIKAGQLDAFGTSRGLVMDLVNAVRTLSASLASARQALQAIADRYVKAPGWAAPTPTTELVWSMYEIARTALSSPRQEGT